MRSTQLDITPEMNELFASCGLHKDSPNSVIIPRKALKKIIDAWGLSNTLRWINGEGIRTLESQDFYERR